MIKKISLFITVIFSTFIFNLKVDAVEYYEKVSVNTEFSEEIDLTNINYIEVFLEDSTEYSKPYLLEKDKNFELLIENVPVGAYKFQYGVVNDDEIGYYKVSATININDELRTVDVLINVSLQGNKQNDRTLTQEDLNRISGTTTSSSSNSNDSSGIIVDDDDETDITSENNEEVTTIPRDIVEARENEERERKKQETRRKNGIIGKIMFSIIGIVAFGALIYAALKISRANK